MNIVEIVFAMIIVAAACLFSGSLFGLKTAQESYAKDCQTLGALRIGEAVFACHPQEQTK